MSQRSLASIEDPAAASRPSRIAGHSGRGERNLARRNLGQTSRAREDYSLRPVDAEVTGLWQLHRDVKAADRSAAETPLEISFGPFRLLPEQRLLLEGDNPVRLGSRALDLLSALVEQPGALLGKQELMAKVWPNVFVDEGNLKVHIAALRRALADGQAGNRYISTVAGRGYCFVAPVIRLADSNSATPQSVATERSHNLPAALTRLFGRDETIDRVALQISQQHLVTLVGAGGVGKTSLALAVARDLCAAFEHGVWFVDLATIGDPLLVPAMVASALGREVSSEDSVSDLLSFLSDKGMLLVLDNCEHVIDGVADVALSVLRAAPRIHILATGREALCVEGERVHRLSPLECPPGSPGLGAAEVLGFPAVQLFVERAVNTLGEFALRDADVPFVVDICRKLDGLPLAIEAAAADVEAFGVEGVASRLFDPLRLPIIRRRMVSPRHRSLRAVLDWSYRLLSEGEQRLLRRLAVFADSFTLADAAALFADAAHPESEIADHMAALVAKSLLATNRDEPEPRFRLPALTRAYAFDKLAESGEIDRVARRRAAYSRELPKPANREGNVIHELRFRSGA
jgi:predicted ATPase/DNA-binding winged helix-turn-helix (wHTH) protein